MLKILKYLKDSYLTISFIVLLLVIQAFSELALPSFTSDMINIGIQQGGIPDAVPEEIRQRELEKLTNTMTAENASLVYRSYDTAHLENGLTVLLLKDISAEERQRLNSLLGPAILQKESASPTDYYLSQIAESLITQKAIPFVRREYLALGVNLEQLQTRYILLAGAKMLTLTLLSMVASALVVFFSGRVAAKLARDLRDNIFKKVLSFSAAELDRFSTASLITRSTNDIQQVQTMMMMLFRLVIFSPILAIGGIVMALRTSPSMTWIVALAAGSIMALIFTMVALAMPRFKTLQILMDKLNLVSREILTGIMVIRAFHNQKHEENRFQEANQKLAATNLFVNRAMSFMFPIMMLIMNAITVLIVYKGAFAIDSGGIQVGDMMAFIQYTMQIIMSFFMMSMMSVLLPRASVSAQRINEILDTEPTISDPPQPLLPDPRQRGTLEFRHVYFRYPDAADDALRDISFTASPGQTTAIIGSTGSGKSTLVNLIPRFYDVNAGEVLVGGLNVRQFSQDQLREKIGYVPQRNILFSGTIASNLRFGREDARSEELERAAAIAQAGGFIQEKDKGYSAAIAQSGSNVSGGQKQRLAIARAIIKEPEIYIFDDSFSALDYRTDAALRQALGQVAVNSTILIVAQRVNTIRHAEQILVLDEGRIVGRGTHGELLARCEVYRQIALSQLSEEELGLLHPFAKEREVRV